MPEFAWYLIATYLSLVFTKTMLMYGTAHVAAGVHQRIQRRMGFETSFAKCYLTMLISIPLITLIHTPFGIFREGWKFFTVYSRRETIRDIVIDYRS